MDEESGGVTSPSIAILEKMCEVRSMEPPSIDLLIKDSSDSALEGLVALWLFGKSPQTRSKARKELDTRKSSSESTLVFDSILALVNAGNRENELIGVLRVLKGFYKKQTTAVVRAFLIRLAVDHPSLDRKVVELVISLAISGPDDQIVKDFNEIGASNIEVLLGILQKMKFERNTLRERFTMTVLRSNHRTLLNNPEHWRRVSLESVAVLTGPEYFSGGLPEAIREPVVRPLLSKSVKSFHLWRVFEFVSAYPHLIELIEVEQVVKAATRSDPSAILFRSATEQLQDDAQRCLAEVGQKLVETENRVAAIEALYRSEIDRSSALEYELSQATERLRRISSERVAAHDSQLRQGRIDVLRSLVDLAEEVRRLADLGIPNEALLIQLRNDTTRSLEKFGVRIIGSPGERRETAAFLDGDVDLAGTVEILAPAYVFEDNGETPLRHALVRPISGEENV